MISRALAYLRGYLPSAAVSRLGRDGSDAYDLVDTLPPGAARAAAWNAYVCQTYADKLCGAGEVAPETATVVRALYDQAGTWLERARDGSDAGDLVLPAWPTPLRSQRELAGMRDTLEALRTYVAFDLGAATDDSRLVSVDRHIATVDSMWIPRATPDLRLGIGDALTRGLAEACALGHARALGGGLGGGDGPDRRSGPPPSGARGSAPTSEVAAATGDEGRACGGDVENDSDGE